MVLPIKPLHGLFRGQSSWKRGGRGFNGRGGRGGGFGGRKRSASAKFSGRATYKKARGTRKSNALNAESKHFVRPRTSFATAVKTNSRVKAVQWPRGAPKGGPADQYIITTPTLAAGINTNKQDFFISQFGLQGPDVGTMLANIRTESPYVLSGGGNVLQPTLYVKCYSEAKIINTGNARLIGSYVVTTSREAHTNTVAGTATDFDNQWAATFDARPSGFEEYPFISIKANKAFFGTNGGRGRYKGSKEINFNILPGQPYSIKTSWASKLTYEDYANLPGTPIIALASGGGFRNCTKVIIVRVHGEDAQLCGTLAAASTPILGAAGAQCMMVVRTRYFYKWAPGNNRPTIYGSNLGVDEAVSNSAESWVAVPALKAQRAVGLPNAIIGHGALNPNSRHEANINFALDCAGDDFTPQVSVLP